MYFDLRLCSTFSGLSGRYSMVDYGISPPEGGLEKGERGGGRKQKPASSRSFLLHIFLLEKKHSADSK